MNSMDRFHFTSIIAPWGGSFIWKYSEDDILLQTIFTPNIVTTVGKQRLASHVATLSNANYWFSHIALGDDDTVAAAIGDLSLTNEIYREAFDSVFASGNTIFGQSQIVATDIGGSTYSIEECALYDAISGGNLICRQVLATSVEISGGEKADVLWGVVMS